MVLGLNVSNYKLIGGISFEVYINLEYNKKTKS